ncbi:MAG: class I SAM-dependent methyltransferase, partial [Clostridiales bacterium]|nr:class I SAM-dependent methyltransferase [Clostridiales bacterium]
MEDKKVRKLLKIFESGADTESVLFNGEDPFMLYHLSSMRSNILSWYDFDPNGTALEIGAECGALTSYLCSHLSSVTALESDEQKFKLLSERVKGLKNAETIRGGIDDVPSGKKFDYITLIGVAVDNEVLTKAKSLLNEGGAIFIAVDNKFGLARWSDPSAYCETGRQMSFEGFKTLVKGAGFDSCDIFYPYPYYVFPLQLFTESRLPKVDELMPSTPTYEGEKLYLFDEGKVGDEMSGEGMYGCFANSFLAVLSDKKSSTAPVYIKFNTTRRPELRIETALYAGNGKLTKAVKKASEPSALTMIDTIESNYNKLASGYKSVKPVKCSKVDGKLEFPFLKGTSLMSDLDLKASSKEQIVKAIGDALDKILDYSSEAADFTFTPKFAQMFPGCCPGSEEKAFPVINIDSNFDNFIVTDDGIVCIDYEWVADFPVPVNYVKYRTLLYYYTKNQAFLRDKIEIRELYERFGLLDRVDLYSCMEECFQQFVYGKYRRYVYPERYRVVPESLEDKKKTEASIRESIAAGKDVQIEYFKKQIEVRDEMLQDISRVVRDPRFALHKIRVRHERRKRNKAVYKLNPSLLDFYKSRHGEYNTCIGNHQVPYEDWIEYVESLDTHNETFEYNPKISVIVPVYNC